MAEDTEDSTLDRAASMRGLWEGLVAGLVAGAVFLGAQVLLAVLDGRGAVGAFRMFASVVLGRNAQLATADNAIATGLIVHIVLSALFGLLFAIYLRHEPVTMRTSRGHEVVIGGLYGVLLWILDLELVARDAYPLWRDPSPAAELFIHVAGYGMVLGFVYAGLERHVRRRRDGKSSPLVPGSAAT